MYKITFVFPTESLAGLAVKTFEEHNKFELDNGFAKECEYSYEVFCFRHATDIFKTKIEADVIVARGLAAHVLRNSGYNIPVVELQITGNELLQALVKSKNMYGNQVVGAVGSSNMFNDVESIGEAIGIKVKTYYINHFNDKEKRKLIDRAYKEGCGVILSGISAYEYAQSHGINAVMIETGRQSIWQAITEAKRTANIAYTEQEKALRVKTILDYAHEGIIALDSQGFVTIINGQAERMLGIKSSVAVGEKIDKVISNSHFSSAVRNNDIYIDEVMKHQNTQLTVNKVPLIYRSEIVGNVITFQDVTKIQEAEGKIREKIYSLGHVAKFTFDNVIGTSREINSAINMARRFAKVNSNILIVGETGTGKEVFAQSIHNSSDRKDGPFVAVNCAALPENLLESELFGYVEGAFTGATKGGKPGMFELAHNGTIFLDEISELPLKLQGRLLRVLQEKKIMRLGHDRVISVDASVIAATNKDLKVLINQGEFREDLYFRINVLKLVLPALRERREDIALLMKYFINYYASEFGREELSIDDKAMLMLQSYRWPGNTRELRNICERLVVIAEEALISYRDVKTAFSDENITTEMPTDVNEKHSRKQHIEIDQDQDNLRNEIVNLEKQRISEALNLYSNNKVRAAEHLGISRTTLWRRRKEGKS